MNKWDTQTERNRLIALTDWTQLNDSPLTAEKKQAFIEYRQELRDITTTYDNNWVNTAWPDLPQV
jgi:hypothetical protein